MKKLIPILSLVLALHFGDSFAQTHIYEHFVSRTDLEVAYLENVPLDSNISINATIIIAKDSVVWESLKSEFHIPQSPHSGDTHYRVAMLRDKKNPTSPESKNIFDSYYLVVNGNRMSISIFHYETTNQYHSLIRLSTKTLINEKD
ncbi:MAG: hypothetical protein HUK17_03970 [Bacteroidales bacterium]|nr:hypothetical protein [Bacteroidales bacterium]